MAQKTKPGSTKKSYVSILVWDYTDEPCHLMYSSFSSPFIRKKLSFNKEKKKHFNHQALKFLFLCFNRSYFSTLSEEKPIARAMASFWKGVCVHAACEAQWK